MATTQSGEQAASSRLLGADQRDVVARYSIWSAALALGVPRRS